MKKKTILITSAIVLLLAVITTIIVISVNRGKIKVFTDTNYPGFYKQKDNNIVFRLKDKNNYDVPWQIEEESGIVEVSAKGKKTGKKVSFSFAPKAPGITNLKLYKSRELFGFNIDIVSVEIPINITENESGMAVNVLGVPTLTDNGGGIGGKNTDNPYVLLNNGDGTARVVFVKGRNDWRISDVSNMANLEWSVIEENMDSCWISENLSYDPDAEVVSTESTEEGSGESSEDEDDGDANSEGKSEKSTGTKPAKTAKDIANITISDEEYEGDSIDLSEYMVDGEIPEDVLKELDKKLENMAKERGEDVPDESATEVSEATTERRTEATTERTTEAAVEATTESSSEAATPDNSSEAATESSSEAAAESDGEATSKDGNEETDAINSEETAEDASTEKEDNSLDGTVDYSGLYDGYNMMYDSTTNSSTEADEETSEEAYTIDPETGELIINEDVLDKRTTIVKETILSVSSEQYKTVEYIKVSFMADGKIILSISRKGPKK